MSLPDTGIENFTPESRSDCSNRSTSWSILFWSFLVVRFLLNIPRIDFILSPLPARLLQPSSSHSPGDVLAVQRSLSSTCQSFPVGLCIYRCDFIPASFTLHAHQYDPGSRCSQQGRIPALPIDTSAAQIAVGTDGTRFTGITSSLK